MAMALPAITGRQLIRLFRLDGWRDTGRTRHGVGLAKADATGRMRVTTIPDKRRPLAPGTLAAILGPKQSNLGRAGLAALIAKHGLK